MKFTKMQGAGNDFIVINNRDRSIEISRETIKMLCTPHFGIGADGLILLETSKVCDIRMNYFNKDGSIAEICGNGIRCLAKYAVDLGLMDETLPFSVETKAKNVMVQVLKTEATRSLIRVEMGKIKFSAKEVPVQCHQSELIGEKIFYRNTELTYGCASMGNPHMVVVVDNLDGFPISEVGSYFEVHPMFKEKCNVSFAQIIDCDNIKMDTWERGVGLTFACGTGTCATVGVLNKMGLVSNKVKAQLLGGNLTIELEDDRVFMTGLAEMVFTGEIAVSTERY